MIKIGNYEPKNKLFVAPMAGYSNVAFRMLCEKIGAGQTYSEFVTYKHEYDNRSYFSKHENNVALQIMGDTDIPQLISCLTQTLSKYPVIKMVDINFGCPFSGNIGTLAGGALLAFPSLIDKILYNVKCITDKPVTIKIRKGINEYNENYLQVLKIAEKNKIDAIAMHGRFVQQRYSGKVDLLAIKKLKAHSSIPVIGNGDIKSPCDFYDMMSMTNCDAVMVGREIIKNPLFIKQCLHYPEKYGIIEDDILEYIKQFIKYSIDNCGHVSFERTKKIILTFLLSNLRHRKRIVLDLMKTEDFNSLEQFLSTKL